MLGPQRVLGLPVPWLLMPWLQVPWLQVPTLQLASRMPQLQGVPLEPPGVEQQPRFLKTLMVRAGAVQARWYVVTRRTAAYSAPTARHLR